MHASVPYAHDQCFWQALLKFGIFTLMLSTVGRLWGKNKKNFKKIFGGSFGGAKFLKFLTRMLSLILRRVPSKHTEHTHQ